MSNSRDFYAAARSTYDLVTDHVTDPDAYVQIFRNLLVMNEGEPIPVRFVKDPEGGALHLVLRSSARALAGYVLEVYDPYEERVIEEWMNPLVAEHRMRDFEKGTFKCINDATWEAHHWIRE